MLITGVVKGRKWRKNYLINKKKSSKMERMEENKEDGKYRKANTEVEFLKLVLLQLPGLSLKQ